MEQISNKSRLVNRATVRFINFKLKKVLNSINKDIDYLISGRAANLINNFNACYLPINVINIKIVENDEDKLLKSLKNKNNVRVNNLYPFIVILQYDSFYIRFDSISKDELVNTEYEQFDDNLFIECK